MSTTSNNNPSTLQRWRWDQGRLEYFQFENLKSIARCLVQLEGYALDQPGDPFRKALESVTDLPFAPGTYKVWRNYKRVFECAFLATNVENRLYVTDFCKRLVSEDKGGMDVDEFLSLFVPRFRFPFPAFNDYERAKNVIYPFCAVLKLLLSNFLIHGHAVLSLENVFALLVGNNCTGVEPIDYYSNLSESRYVPDESERRQVREMLIFISQLSILKWHDGRLHLDMSARDYEEYDGFLNITTPVLTETKVQTDDVFIEGKRTRVTHIKIERSPLLRRLFLQTFPGTTCDMCVGDMKRRYPWTDNILEVHHVLPLSSALLVTSEGTSFSDIVGICPNCHRSVHSYYKNWLNENSQDDFKSREEAKEIYKKAKTSTVT